MHLDRVGETVRVGDRHRGRSTLIAGLADARQAAEGVVGGRGRGAVGIGLLGGQAESVVVGQRRGLAKGVAALYGIGMVNGVIFRRGRLRATRGQGALRAISCVGGRRGQIAPVVIGVFLIPITPLPTFCVQPGASGGEDAGGGQGVVDAITIIVVAHLRQGIPRPVVGDHAGWQANQVIGIPGIGEVVRLRTAVELPGGTVPGVLQGRSQVAELPSSLQGGIVLGFQARPDPGLVALIAALNRLNGADPRDR